MPRPACWACYDAVNEDGCPYILEVRLSYWGVTNTGALVPLIGDDEEGLKDARRYRNFAGFKNDRSGVRVRPVYGC